MSEPDATPWARGRFDDRAGPAKVLFGRMYEDPRVELEVFPPGARVLCIASAGDTAMALAPRHPVVAVDINPGQLDYAARRLAGARAVRGTAEKVMGFGRRLAPLVGWTRSRLETFLDLDDPEAQADDWRRHLDTRRFRAAFDAAFSVTALRAVYAPPFLDFLPPHLGRVMRRRLERGLTRHPNRTNPYARGLLLGSFTDAPPPAEAAQVELVLGDVAEYLEAGPAGRFDAFTLSNILDGAPPDFRARLFAAVRHAAAPGAKVVLRSFGEPTGEEVDNRAADERALLWGVVDVRPARW